MNESLFIRKQVLSWEYWLSIPTLVVRLLVTIAHDIPKVYRVREVILGFCFFGRFPVLSLTWDGFVASSTVAGLVALACCFYFVLGMWLMPRWWRCGCVMVCFLCDMWLGWHIHSIYD